MPIKLNHNEDQCCHAAFAFEHKLERRDSGRVVWLIGSCCFHTIWLLKKWEGQHKQAGQHTPAGQPSQSHHITSSGGVTVFNVNANVHVTVTSRRTFTVTSRSRWKGTAKSQIPNCDSEIVHAQWKANIIIDLRINRNHVVRF